MDDPWKLLLTVTLACDRWCHKHHRPCTKRAHTGSRENSPHSCVSCARVDVCGEVFPGSRVTCERGVQHYGYHAAGESVWYTRQGRLPD